MLGGGMGSAMEPQFPPTAACKAHKSKIQLVAIVQILLALPVIFMTGGNGIYSIVACMCLFCSTMSFNYCCVLIYIILTFMDFL